MRILSLKLKNFMNIKEADLVFQKGLNVFQGRSGQGKSSVLEAIAFCIVGRTRGSSWKDYVKTGEDSFNIILEILKTDKEEDLLIFDYTGDLKSGTMDKKISYHGMEKTGEGANKFLEELFDTHMLRNTVFSMQDASKVSAMKSAEIRDLLKKIFNSDFPNIVEKIESDTKATKDEEQKVSMKIDLLKSNKYELYENIIYPDPASLITLKAELESVQANEVSKQKYKFYLGKLTDLSQLEVRMTSLKERKTAAEMKGESVRALEPQLQKNKSELLVRLRGETLVLEGLEQNLEDETTTLNTLQTKKKTFNESKQEDTLRITQQANHYKQAELNGLIGVALKHIEAHKRGECTECGQKTNASNIPQYEKEIEDHKEAIAVLKKESNDINLKIQEERTKSKEIDLEIDSQNTKIDEIKTKVTTAEKAMATTESSIKLTSQELVSFSDKLQSEDLRVQEVQKDIDALSKEIETLQTWCNDNKVELPEEVARSYDAIQKEIDDFLSKVQLAKTQEEQNILTLKKKEEDRKQIIILTDTLNTYQLTLKGLKELKTIFDTNFPNYISLKACTILQTYMNNFFEDIKNKFVVKLDLSKKGVDILYQADKEPEWRMSRMASGMEQALLSLGFNVSVATAYGNDLIFLDEPDASCDDESSEKLFKVVSGIDKFQQMVIITHKEPAKDYLRDNGALVYTVQSGEFSREG